MSHSVQDYQAALNRLEMQGWEVVESYTWNKQKGPLLTREDGLKLRVAYLDINGADGAPGLAHYDFGLSPLGVQRPQRRENFVPPQPVYVPVGFHVLLDKKWQKVDLDLDGVPHEERLDLVLRQVVEMFPAGAPTRWRNTLRNRQGVPTRMGLLMNTDEEDPSTSRRLGILFEDE